MMKDDVRVEGKKVVVTGNKGEGEWFREKVEGLGGEGVLR